MLKKNLIFYLFIIRMADNNNVFNQFPESVSLMQNTYNLPKQNGMSSIFEYKNQRHWVKVLYPYSYDIFEAKDITQFK